MEVPCGTEAAFSKGRGRLLMSQLDPTGGSAPRPAGEAVAVPTPRLATLDPALSVRFLGVRGSIPTPGPLTTAGGNTACVEVTAGDTRIILDAGSGLRALGDERMRHGPRHSTILLSH